MQSAHRVTGLGNRELCIRGAHRCVRENAIHNPNHTPTQANRCGESLSDGANHCPDPWVCEVTKAEALQRHGRYEIIT